jgi:hypothetical protein
MQFNTDVWGLSPVMVRGQPSGDPLRWTPQGLVATALDLPNEPVRTHSWYGVRGSQKYPFGKAFPDYLELDGWDAKYPLLGLGVIVLLVYLLFMR